MVSPGSCTTVLRDGQPLLGMVQIMAKESSELRHIPVAHDFLSDVEQIFQSFLVVGDLEGAAGGDIIGSRIDAVNRLRVIDVQHDFGCGIDFQNLVPRSGPPDVIALDPVRTPVPHISEDTEVEIGKAVENMDPVLEWHPNKSSIIVVLSRLLFAQTGVPILVLIGGKGQIGKRFRSLFAESALRNNHRMRICDRSASCPAGNCFFDTRQHQVLH